MWRRQRRESSSRLEADMALRSADRNLREVKRRGHEVRQVSEALRNIRERNHFVEALEDIILGKNGSP